jgi:hypothetical protein
MLLTALLIWLAVNAAAFAYFVLGAAVREHGIGPRWLTRFPRHTPAAPEPAQTRTGRTGRFTREDRTAVPDTDTRVHS